MASSSSSLLSSVTLPSSLSFTTQAFSAGVKSTASLGSMGLSRKLKVTCEATASTASPETLQKVVEIVAKQLATPSDTIKPHSKFQDLGADSLDQVEIVMALEEEFNISVNESGAELISTVQDAADLIEKSIEKS